MFPVGELGSGTSTWMQPVTLQSFPSSENNSFNIITLPLRIYWGSRVLTFQMQTSFLLS